MIETIKELEETIEQYFLHCEKGKKVQVVRKGGPQWIKKPIPCEIAGFAHFMGCASEDELWDTLGANSMFARHIARACLRIESQVVCGSMTGEFDSKIVGKYLQNKHKWRDVKQLDVTTQVTYSDTELDNRLQLLEDKIKRVANVPQSPVISGDHQPKLIE